MIGGRLGVRGRGCRGLRARSAGRRRRRFGFLDSRRRRRRLLLRTSGTGARRRLLLHTSRGWRRALLLTVRRVHDRATEISSLSNHFPMSDPLTPRAQRAARRACKPPAGGVPVAFIAPPPAVIRTIIFVLYAGVSPFVELPDLFHHNPRPCPILSLSLLSLLPYLIPPLRKSTRYALSSCFAHPAYSLASHPPPLPILTLFRRAPPKRLR